MLFVGCNRLNMREAQQIVIKKQKKTEKLYWVGGGGRLSLNWGGFNTPPNWTMGGKNITD